MDERPEAGELAQGFTACGRMRTECSVSDFRAQPLHASRTLLPRVEISNYVKRNIHCELWILAELCVTLTLPGLFLKFSFCYITPYSRSHQSFHDSRRDFCFILLTAVMYSPCRNSGITHKQKVHIRINDTAWKIFWVQLVFFFPN